MDRSLTEQPNVEEPETPGSVRRVGGDLTAAVTETVISGKEKDPFTGYRFGEAMLIDTPLPVGYPAPTPPGAIDLKNYPAVRRAEVNGRMSPGLGRNMAFFPLFQHISSRDIAMTSPVEVDFHRTHGAFEARAGALPDAAPPVGDRPEAPPPPEAQIGDQPGWPPDKGPRWTMSFLYRTPELGPTGRAGPVEVVDTAPLTVISFGLRGPYAGADERQNWDRLYQWLAEHPEWEEVGPAAPPRALFYNGPERRERDLWTELQIPIKPAAKVQVTPADRSTDTAPVDTGQSGTQQR